MLMYIISTRLSCPSVWQVKTLQKIWWHLIWHEMQDIATNDILSVVTIVTTSPNVALDWSLTRFAVIFIYPGFFYCRHDENYFLTH